MFLMNKKNAKTIRYTRIALVLLAIFSICGCGLKGPLYIPKNDTANMLEK